MVDNIVPQSTEALAVVTQYDISQPMRAKIEQRFGKEITYLTVTALRQRRPATILRYLRSLKVIYVVVAVESEGALQAAPILKPLAAMIRAREYFLFRWDDRLEPFSRTGQAVTVLKVIFTSLQAAFLMRGIQRKVGRLAAASRIQFRPSCQNKAVAYINSNLSFSLMAGGSIGHVAGVVNAFAEAGMEVKYFGAARNRMIRDAESVVLRARHTFCFPLDVNPYIFVDDTIGQIAEYMTGQHYFVYQRMNLINFSGVKLSRKFNVPLIVEYNGSEVWASKHWGGRIRYEELARAVEESTLRHAHLVVTVSTTLRDELLSRGIEADRIVLYPNCVDPTIFDPARFSPAQTEIIRRQLSLPEDACVVMFVGTFGLWHGAEVLATAILMLIERERARLEAAKAVFVFVGAGVTLPKVRAMLSGPVAEGFVRFTGLVPQEQAPAYLAAADICVSPHVENPDGSRFFGSPTKLFEYMAMAKPIIASKLEQIGEVLSPGIDVDDIGRHPSIHAYPDALAAMVTPGRADELARAILFLAESPDWRCHLGENARAEALAKYTWQTHVGIILDRIATMAARAGSQAATRPHGSIQ